MADPQELTKTPDDYDEYGSEPEQDEGQPEDKPLKPDEALTDPA